MKLCFFVFALLVLASCREQSLTILTWNIRAAKGMDNGNHLKELALVMRRESPDIIALQEVDSVTTRSEKVDQAGWLAAQLDMKSYFAHNLDYKGGAYGTAILTRLPVVLYKHLKLPDVKEREPRGLQQIAVVFQDDTLNVFNTHLDYLKDDSLRYAESLVVDQLVKNTRGLVFLSGDLNDTPNSRTIDQFTKHLLFSLPGHFTFPADLPQYKIDYILYRPAKSIVLEKAAVLPDTCSDHRGVIARFKFIN